MITNKKSKISLICERILNVYFSVLILFLGSVGGLLGCNLLNFKQDCAVGIVARRRKPLRNAKLERFWPGGIFINLLRTKIVKQALQYGFSSHSRCLLHNLGLKPFFSENHSSEKDF